LYCQWVADATGRQVIAGPAEATALGNFAVQAAALGLTGSLAEARQLVSEASKPDVFEPKHDERWLCAAERLVACSTASSTRAHQKEVVA
jgi:rhamnulokinase